MKQSILVVLLGWIGVQVGAAQSVPWRPMEVERPASVWAAADERRATAEADGAHYLTSFGGGLLGAAIGGGLGLLVGPVPQDALFGDQERRRYPYDENDTVHLAPIGVWVGSMVGAMAGARTGMHDKAMLAAGGGSLVGSLLGLATFATASNGRDLWRGAGFVIGSAAGAALGAVLVGPAPEPRGLVRRRGDGLWTLGMPTVNWQPPHAPFGRSHVRVVLVSARL